MGKIITPLFESKAQLFSDTHAFAHYNGGAERQLTKSYAFGLNDNFQGSTHYIGDIIDFEFLEARLKSFGYTPDTFPKKFLDVLRITAPQGKEKLSYKPSMYERDMENHMRFFDAAFFKASKGKESTFYHGNHDPGIALLAGESFGDIQIKEEDIFETENAKRFLVEHGQNFDKWFTTNYTDWVSYYACRIIDGALKQDYLLAKKLPFLEDGYLLTNSLKTAAKTIGVVKPFRKNAATKAHKMGVDGVICGHIHKLDDRMITVPGHEDTKIRYINTGDGLTHGNVLLNTHYDVFEKLRKGDLPPSALKILEDVNPLENFRGLTLDYLQTAWEAELEYLRAKDNKIEIEHAIS